MELWASRIKTQHTARISPVALSVKPFAVTARTWISGYLRDFLATSVGDELECTLVFVETSEYPGSHGGSPSDRRCAELAVLGRWVVLVPRDTAKHCQHSARTESLSNLFSKSLQQAYQREKTRELPLWHIRRCQHHAWTKSSSHLFSKLLQQAGQRKASPFSVHRSQKEKRRQLRDTC